MPKVVTYVRADDARAIEAVSGEGIELWVRSAVRDQIAVWHFERAEALRAKPMPEPWAQHAESKKEE